LPSFIAKKEREKKEKKEEEGNLVLNYDLNG
jgi:hypothetical protein